MSKAKRFQAVKGTRDILPPESARWNQVEQTARKVFASYNFQEIRLPLFEETELFARSVGVDTEIVQKEMYTFVDRAIPQLADLRSVLSFLIRAPRATDEFHKRLLKFEGLAENIERAYAAAEIPQSEENAKAIKSLARLKVRAAEAYKHRDEPRIVEAFANLMAAFAAELAGFELGYSLCLRPEATASVVRAYIEHGLHTRPGLAKLYYIGPMFRRERPQKGRFRQFYQIGAEVLGSSDAPAIDAEVIELVMAFIERCGLPVLSPPGRIEGKGTALYLNSIGCSACRSKYIDVLRKQLQKVKKKLGADSQRRIETNPLRVLDSKLEEEQAIIEKLPSILDHLCTACREHFAAVQQELKDRGLGYEINWRLVRGLDYYMRTTFEITAPGLGAQNAICGGGRYDGLVELLGGPNGIKGIGWALGTDRLVLALEQTKTAKAGHLLDVYLVWLGAAARVPALRLARKLREANVSTEMAYEEAKLRKALESANKLGARYAIIVGEEELARSQFTLRDMKDGTQRTLREDELVRELMSAGPPHR